MMLHLHTPGNQAHLEDLRDRLTSHLALATVDPFNRMRTEAVIEALVDVVCALDRGFVSVADTQAVFGQFRIPAFSFAKWLDEMVDEGVYVDLAFEQAA